VPFALIVTVVSAVLVVAVPAYFAVKAIGFVTALAAAATARANTATVIIQSFLTIPFRW